MQCGNRKASAPARGKCLALADGGCTTNAVSLHVEQLLQPPTLLRSGAGE